MAVHGSALHADAFDLGEMSFCRGWTLHKAGANTSDRPRSVMTGIYVDASIRPAPALNPVYGNDRDQSFPRAREGEVIDIRKHPVIWQRRCTRAGRVSRSPLDGPLIRS